MKRIFGQDKQKWLVILFVIIFITAVVSYFVIGPDRIKSILRGAFEPLFFWEEKAKPGKIVDVKNRMNSLDPIYVENLGQVNNPSVKYYTGIGGTARTYFYENKVIYDYAGEIVEYNIVGAKLEDPEGVDRGTEKFMYERGDISLNEVPNYKKIVYKDAYPGIDLEFSSQTEGEKNTFVVKSGVDSGVIKTKLENDKLVFEGVNPNGEVMYELNGNILTDMAPYCFQLDSDKVQIEIECHYKVDYHGSIGYDVGDYDHGKELFIDPIRQFTVIGGSTVVAGDYGNGISVDDLTGDIYLVGNTYAGASFSDAQDIIEGATGNIDVFIVKLNSVGIRQWTFIAASADLDNGRKVQWTNDGGGGVGLYVVGSTKDSGNFAGAASKTTEGVASQEDAFVLKLNASGARLWTYIAAGDINTLEHAQNLVVDPNVNSVLVTGYTSSSTILTGVAPANSCGNLVGNDMFVLSLAYNGNKNWTFAAGGINNAGAQEYGNAIAYDSTDNIYVVGVTNNDEFCLFNGPARVAEGTAYGDNEAYVLKLNSAGVPSKVFIGYSDVAGVEEANDIAVDQANADVVYVVGTTDLSSDFCDATDKTIEGSPGNQDAFILQLDSDLNRLRTFIGASYSSQGDRAFGLVIASDGSIVVTGSTDDSANFCDTSLKTVDGTTGSSDMYAIRLDYTFSRYWTFIGASPSADAGNDVDLNLTGGYSITGFSMDSANFCQGTNKNVEGTMGLADAFLISLAELAVSPGTVVTQAANNIGMGGAMLNGNITDTGGGYVEERGFEYGLTVAYGSALSQTGVFNNGPYYVPISGLAPVTLYHYRAYIINGLGTYYGLDATFTTLPARQIFLDTIGTANSDVASAVAQMGDGGYLVAGISNNYGNTSMPIPYLARFDSSGYSVWTKTYENLGVAEIMDIQSAGTSGFIITGSAYSDDAGRQMLLMKFDPNGVIEWTKKLGNTN